jgi:hypothetical protein
MTDKIDIEQLYSNYGRTDDATIRSLLAKIQIVTLTHKGVDTTYGYYAIGNDLFTKIVEKPRNISHTFSSEEPSIIIDHVEEFKRIPVLVKSSSPFFLKPDIGEVFDQMTEEDIGKTKAIYTDVKGAETCGGNDSHFLVHAVLLKESRKKHPDWF